MSADTINPPYTNPQDLNRYSYVLNNPMRYTDPTGHRVCEDDGGGTCLSEKQETDKYKAKLHKHKGKDKDKDKDDDILHPTTSNQNSQMCSTNPDACIVGGAALILATDLFVGLPAAAVIILTGGITPSAVAAEILETVVVLPVTIFGVILIEKGLDAKRAKE